MIMVCSSFVRSPCWAETSFTHYQISPLTICKKSKHYTLPDFLFVVFIVTSSCCHNRTGGPPPVLRLCQNGDWISLCYTLQSRYMCVLSLTATFECFHSVVMITKLYCCKVCHSKCIITNLIVESKWYFLFFGAWCYWEAVGRTKRWAEMFLMWVDGRKLAW